MKALKIIGIIVLFILALIFIVPLFLPGSFYVTRTAEIDKPIEQVFKSATDYTLRAKWDPWLEQEPTAEVKVENVPGMIGSWYEWKGEEIGSGRMEILEVEMPFKIVSSLNFIEPFESSSTVIWEFEPMEGKTKVTWGFKGDAAYPMERIFLANIDGQIGPDFEKGLANFKKLVEEMKTIMAKTGEITEEETMLMNAMLISYETDMQGIQDAMAEGFTKLMTLSQEKGWQIAGAPFTLYHSWDSVSTKFECGLPVLAKPDELEDGIEFREIESFKAVQATHYGPYDQLMMTYEKMMGYFEEKGYEINGPTLEVYLTDPQKEMDMSKWETQIFMPF